jgi:rhomboid protease GluP
MALTNAPGPAAWLTRSRGLASRRAIADDSGMSEPPPQDSDPADPTSGGGKPPAAEPVPPPEPSPAEPAPPPEPSAAEPAPLPEPPAGAESAPPQAPPAAIADEPPPPPPRFMPWVTYALAAANVAIWILCLALGASPIDPSPLWLLDHGGNLGAITLDGEEWRLFTSMFLHAGVLHVGMNMLGLVGGGRLAERLFGRPGFAAIYLISGLAGSVATALRPGVVSVGASGAIFGVLGAVGAYYALHRERMDQATAKEASGLLVFVAYNLVYGLQKAGIDMYAHLGGLAGGFLCGLALELGRGERRGRRTAAVAAIGLAVVIGAAFAVPAPVDPAQEERKAFQTFAAIEQKVQARWSELVGQARRQEVTDDALAAAIEQDILAPWRAGRAAFERSGAGGARREAVLAYLRDMQAGWELVASGLRQRDGAAVERGVKRLQDTGAAAAKSLRE